MASAVTEFDGGPFRGGATGGDLVVDAPPLDRFGIDEARRMVTVAAVLTIWVLRAAVVALVRRRPLSTGASEGLVDAFEHLGPTFVKLGQMVASAPGLFPAPIADACLRCLDEVGPFPGEVARRQVEENLGVPCHEAFATFDDTPLSAASIAQVHAVTLHDGRDAVVKLQRPDLRHRMNCDLRIMARLARLAAHTKVGRHTNVTGMVADLHTVTNQELNFALEAHRQDAFRSKIGHFGDNDGITAPEVYWSHCGPTMICMERMYGIPLDRFDEIRDRGIDGELILRRGIKVWMEAAMLWGPFHGDVHAGNLWLLDDGRCTYLDFGIMGELDDDWKSILRDLQFTAMIDGDYSRVVRNWKRVGVFPDDIGDDEEVGARIKMIVEPLLDQALGEVSLAEMMKQNLELLRSFGATAPQEMVLINKQLLYFERYAKELAPDYSMARDVFLIRNIFPDDVARVCEERGITLPD